MRNLKIRLLMRPGAAREGAPGPGPTPSNGLVLDAEGRHLGKIMLDRTRREIAQQLGKPKLVKVPV